MLLISDVHFGINQQCSNAALDEQIGHYDGKQIETFGFVSQAEETIAQATNQ